MFAVSALGFFYLPFPGNGNPSAPNGKRGTK